MNFYNLIDKIKYVIYFLITCIEVGLLISIILWLNSSDFPIEKNKYPKYYRFIFKTSILSFLIIITMIFIRASQDILVGILFTVSFLIILRILRLYYIDDISKFKLNLLTIFDFLICGIYLAVLLTLIEEMSYGNIISPGKVIWIPFFYAISCVYIIYNFTLINSKKVRLATWRLISYAFPEGKEHRKGRIGKPLKNEKGFLYFWGWISAFLVIFVGYLFGYWLSGHRIATITYFATNILLMVIIIFIKGRRAFQGKTLSDVIRTSIVLSGIILVFYSVLLFPRFDIFLQISYSKRIPISVANSMLIAILAVQLIPNIPNRLYRIIVNYFKNSLTLNAIRSIADSALITTFSHRKTKAIQVFLVSGVFFLYFIIPKCENVFKIVGLTEFKGKPIGILLSEFEEIAHTWVQQGSSSFELSKFIFGNQGLVLLYLLWCCATYFGWIDIGDRLKVVPNLCKSRISKVFTNIHVLIFYFFFSPFFFAFSLIIPLAGSRIIGYSLAVILSVFTFGFFLPKIVAYFLSLGYLVATIINTNLERDSININSASFNDIMLLPGIGFKLAKNIIHNRPYNKTDDLMQVKWIGYTKFDYFKDIIHI